MREFFLLMIFCGSLVADSFSAKLKPFTEKYCVDCHGEKKQKGKFRIDLLSMNLTDFETAEQWQFVLDELNGATMPPEDEPQPEKQELTEILEALTYKIEDAKKLHSGKTKETVMRRLNRREYINSLYELTGVRLQEKEVIADQSPAEYDNFGEGLFMSAFMMQKYREYAYKALDRGLAKKSAKVAFYENEPAKLLNSHMRRKMQELKSKKFQTYDKRKKTNVSTKPEYDSLKAYLSQQGIESGVLIDVDSMRQFKLPKKTKESPAIFHGLDRYEVTLKVMVKNLKPGSKAYAVIDANNDDYRRHIDVTHALNKMTEVKVEALCKVGAAFNVDFYVSKDEPKKKKRKKRKKGSFAKIDPKAPKLILNKFSLLKPERNIDSDSFNKVFYTKKESGESEETYAAKIIKNFATKAYRHKEASPEFLKVMLAVFKSNREHGLNFTESVKEPLAVILSSPKFIYLSEESEGQYVSDLELANRLSYFLWSSAPDDELYRLAKSGTLRSEKVLAKQVERMLEDDKSKFLASGFMNKWLEMEKLDIIEVKNDKSGPQKYNFTIEDALRQEPLLFFRALATKNLSLRNMLHSKFSILNQTLVAYYNYDIKMKDDQFHMVNIPANSARGGLLGMAAILAMNGNGEHSSPVLRGNFVLTRIMGMSSPPPPPNVPDLEVQTKGNIREKLLAHQGKPQCASCHKRIDPAGFGLESFDQSGQWLGVKDRNLVKVLPGKLPGLGSYKNFFEQKKLLVGNEKNFVKSFIEELSSYAFARKVGFADATLIDFLMVSAAKNDYKLGSIIADIVTSKEFKSK